MEIIAVGFERWVNQKDQTTGIGMDELQISPADPRGSPGKDQQAAGVGILLQIMMLVLSFVLGHVLRRHRFYYLPEASASLLIGGFLLYFFTKLCYHNVMYLFMLGFFGSCAWFIDL